MVHLWILHIDSLRRTFDQSVMKIFQRVQEIWSGQESVTDGQRDGLSEPTFMVRGFNFVITLCFIALRYIIHLWVRELIALKILRKFTMGHSP